MSFRHIGIVGKYGAAHVSDTIARTVAVLRAYGLSYYLDRETMPAEYQHCEHTLSKQQWQDIDLCIVIGGDGTFLHAGRALLAQQIPLLGIHTGRLGFLADLTPTDLEAQLGAVLNGNYRCEKRHTLAVTVEGNGNSACYYAVNDAVIHGDKARMIELDVYTHCRHLSHYRADGLIIATPTGSTAYALSAGGPIIEPDLPVSLVVPICPHTLTQRPVVIDANSPISVAVCANQDNICLSIDGQQQHRLSNKDSVMITAGMPLPVVHPVHYHFQDRLRAKLNWGIAPEDKQE